MPLFEGVSDEELHRIAGWFEEREVAAGSRPTSEGALGYVFFIVLEGTAEAKIGERTVGTLEPGNFFGEVALLGDGRRMADVVAATPMRVGVMFGTQFRLLEDSAPVVVERLRTAMNERLDIAGIPHD
jgi:CRP-like cAMP-binding protein